MGLRVSGSLLCTNRLETKAAGGRIRPGRSDPDVDNKGKTAGDPDAIHTAYCVEAGPGGLVATS